MVIYPIKYSQGGLLYNSFLGILILVLSQPYLTNSATVNTLDSQLTLIIAMALYDTLKWLTLREVYHFD